MIDFRYHFGETIDNAVAIKVNATGPHATPIFLQEWYDAVRAAAGSYATYVPYLHILPRTAWEENLWFSSRTFVFGMAIILSFG